MRWPASLGLRLLLAGLLGAVGVAALALWVETRSGASAAARVVAVPATPHEPIDDAMPRRIVPVPAVAGRVLLTSQSQIVPAEAVFVVQLLPDGTEVVLRPPPPPPGPTTPAEWPGDAVVVLPTADLARLEPAARGALVGLFARLVGTRPVPVERFLTLDFELPRAALERLLAWVP